jgi:hypothetical protein
MMSKFLEENEARMNENGDRIIEALEGGDSLVVLDDTDLSPEPANSANHYDETAIGRGTADEKETGTCETRMQSESGDSSGYSEVFENPLRASALPASSRTKAEPRVTFLSEPSAEVGNVCVGSTKEVSAAVTPEAAADGAGASYVASTEIEVAESASESKWIKAATEAGEPYYYDQISGETCWKAPPGYVD